MTLLILGAVFIGTLCLVVGAYIFANRRRLAAAAVARERLHGARESVARGLLREERASELPLLDRFLTGRSFTLSLSDQLQRAGSQLSPGAFLFLVVACILVGILLGSLREQRIWIPMGGVAGLILPIFWLKRKVRKRRQAFETQLPEAIDMIVTAMRAGYSFQAAMRFIGEEMPAPLGPEFARFYEEQRLGVEVRTALLGIQERIQSLDFKMLATAVLIQRETGGTLSDILANIAELMRERVAVRAQIETLVSEPKMSARVLAAAPVVVYFGLLLLNPEYVEPLTTTGLGRAFLIGAAISATLGYWILTSMADVDY
jgi:tight adherence protein B